MPDIVPFGKYRGQPVEVLRADPGYTQWLLAQDWFRDRFATIHTLIVNNFGEPSETPEHNALQAKFLDHHFCYALLRRVGPEWIKQDLRELLQRRIDWRRQEKHNAIRQLCNCAVDRQYSLEREIKETQAYLAKATLDDEWYAKQLKEADAKLAQLHEWWAQEGRAERWREQRKERWREIYAMPETDKRRIGYGYWSVRTRDTLESKEADRQSCVEILAQASAALTAYDNEPSPCSPLRFDIQFEHHGWDVFIQAQLPGAQYYQLQDDPTREFTATAVVEIKPALGDDFPAVLRQMKANPTEQDTRRVLAYDRFTASGATLDQVKAIFAASGFAVLALGEITR
jgi:hypothetical protein